MIREEDFDKQSSFPVTKSFAMKYLALKINDIEFLNTIKKKLNSRTPLTSKEQRSLLQFLSHLPSSESLLAEHVELDKNIKITVFDMKEMWPHLNRWIELLRRLPKNNSQNYPSTGWVDASESPDIASKNILIQTVFIPSLYYSQKEKNSTFTLNLKTDGSGEFKLNTIEDTENFPELYLFKGSWKESYYLLVRTLQHGWPQQKFPRELQKYIH